MEIGLVAGEASGDALGAALIKAIRTQVPDAHFNGLAGPRMMAAGCRSLPGYEKLSVMGLSEVLRHLPGLMHLRGELVRHFKDNPPDCFIGLDAPDFNFGLERKLRRANIPTVHYVSPTVWAWRPGRVKMVARSCHLVLCLFPFEPVYYREADVDAVYVGHPLADSIPLSPDKGAARRSLGLDSQARVIALLPGSRSSEVARLMPDFAGAAQMLSEQRDTLQFILPLARPDLHDSVREALQTHAPNLSVKLVHGRADAILSAADLALVASGTATLEAMLYKCPMVVGYRLSNSSHFMLKRIGLLKAERYALPNILTGRELVPELMQDECSAENLAREASSWLDDPQRVQDYQQVCEHQHRRLRCDAAQTAANAVLKLVERKSK